MPWIQHFSRLDIQDGMHYDPGQNTVLIQIADASYFINDPTSRNFVIPKYKFHSVHQFAFDDIDDAEISSSITDEQAKKIASILRECYAQNLNVMVHCKAGLCRSSAVAIAGMKIGFVLEDKTRIPNKLVLLKIAKELGVYVDRRPGAYENFYNLDFSDN